MLPLTKAVGNAWNMLPSLGLRWWQHMIVKCFNEDWIAPEFTACNRTVLIPIIHLGLVDLAIPFKLCGRRKTISDQNCDLLRRSVKLNGRRTNLVKYIHRPPFPSHGQLCVAFSWSPLFDNVAVAIADGRRQRVENDRLKTCNIVYREVLEMFRWRNKSLFMKCFTVSMYELIVRVQLTLLYSF